MSINQGIRTENKTVTKTKQKLSPRAQQLGKLIEMSPDELDLYVKTELENNVALEEKEHTDPEETDTDTRSEEERVRDDYADPDDVPDYRYKIRNSSPDDYVEPVVADTEETLYDIIQEQLSVLNLTDEEKLIADYIVGSLDDNGLLTDSVSAISNDIITKESEYIPPQKIENVRKIIQGLEPAGIASLSVQECLVVQLEAKEQTPAVKLAKKIISDYFRDFFNLHFDQVQASLAATDEEMAAARKAIKKLNPYPGAAYSGSSSQPIIPEFEIEVEDGITTVTIPNNVPDLQISESYRMAADDFGKKKSAEKTGRSEDELIRRNVSDARNLIELLKDRQQKLSVIIKAIIEFQKDYILSGEESDLRPMVLKDIEDITGIDQSVISRATSDKYVSINHEIRPVRSFFSEKIATVDGDEVASREVMAALKEIVDGEDKNKPYSDENLCKLLKRRNYNIARRTVAKYRDRIGIPVARLRKNVQL